MAKHAKNINWSADAWWTFHKCVDGHQWVLRITRSNGRYWWEVRRGGPRFISGAKLMDTGGSTTLAAAKLDAIHRMHQLVVDFVPELVASRNPV